MINGTVGEFHTLNPIIAGDGESFAAIAPVFDSLTGASPIDASPMPLGLADWWEIAPDGVTYTFHLNTRAKWHDGADFTAEDVKFTFDAQGSEELGSAYTGIFLESVASYRVIDPDTFEVTTNGVRAEFLYDIGLVSIIARHIWEPVPFAEWASDPGSTGQDTSRVVGTGLFRFAGWAPGESITYARNDAYHDVVANVERLVLRIYPDSTAYFNGLLTGELDIAGLEPEEIETAQSTEGLVVQSYPTFGFGYYMTNLDPAKTTLFQDRRVRQALFYALDREAIVRDILLGRAEVAYGLQPSISVAYAPERMTTTYTYDPDKARQLLTEAGWTDTDGDGVVDKDGQPFRFTLSYTVDTHDQMVAYIQDAWKAIGVAMEPEPIDFNLLLEMVLQTFDFEMAILGNGIPQNASNRYFYACNQYPAGFNSVKYCNPEVDRLYEQASRELDPARRVELLIQADNLVNEDLPMGIMHFNTAVDAHRDRVHNVFPGAFGSGGFEYVWVEQE